MRKLIEVASTLRKIAKEKIDIEGIADFLANGIEHSESDKESVSWMATNYGLSKEQAAKIVKSWWAMEAMPQFHMTLSQLKTWIRNQCK